MDNDQLIAKIRAGHNPTIAILYQRMYAKCVRFLLSKGGTKEEAKDFLQDAMYLLCNKIQEDSGFRITKSVDGFLFGVFKNLWREKSKQAKKSKVYLDLDDEGSRLTESIAIEEDLLARLDTGKSLLFELIEQLGKNCKEVLMRFYIEGQTLIDIAEDLGMTHGSMRQKRKRCMNEYRALYLAHRQN